MMNLKNVTLVCADDTIDSHVAYSIFNKVSQNINFFDCKFYSSKVSNCINKNINSIQEYSKFLIKDLNSEINSEFCLIIQKDGFPINLAAWTDEYLKYDYIGAPWYTQPWPLDETVGNGGFSLRSKRYLEESSKLDYSGIDPEDVFLCRKMSKHLRSVGVKFAPHELAYKFSVEDLPYKGQFGFHGKNTYFINKQFNIFS